MDQYFQQFKNLPRELRQSVSSEEKVKTLEEIEKKFNLKLIKLIVRVMIKNVSWLEVEKFCQENFNLSAEKARELKADLKEKIFNEVLSYLEKVETSKQRIEEIKKPIQVQQEPRKQQILSINRGEESVISKQPVQNLSISGEKLEEKKEQTSLSLNTQKVSEDFQKIKTSINVNLSQDDLIKKIINQLNLYFEDDNLVKRFSNIIKNYLRDIRTEAQSEELLRHSKKTNGLEMTFDQAAMAIKIAQEFKRQTTPTSKEYFVKRETDKGDLQKIEVEREEEQEDQKKVDHEIKKRFENGTINPFFQKIIKPLEIQSPKPSKQIPNKLNESPEKIKEGFSISIRKPADSNLVRDVSNGRLKALGPVEELAEITLTDLKHWGGGVPTTKIILDKINLLKEISLTKKAEAIRAWQKSQLYGLYLEVGRVALQNNQSISQTIEERKKNNLPTMESDDFDAISELNKKLRF